MKALIDWLLENPQAVFTAVGALGVWYWGYVRARKKELADPATLPEWKHRLADSPRLGRYRNGIEGALGRVDRFFGEKHFGWRALNMCWFIAFIYPLVLFIGTWAAGGPHTLGVLELLPASFHWALRWIFVMGYALFGYGLVLGHALVDTALGRTPSTP